MSDFPNDAILVVLEAAPGGGLESAAAGLIGAAAQLGPPIALVLSEDQALAAAAVYGFATSWDEMIVSLFITGPQYT
ncbi:hypothetical protein ACFPZL_11480, partial [Leucobacter soli]